MTVRVLALASGVTSLESHRLALMPLSHSAGTLNNRSGIYPTVGAAALSTVSAMVCAIAPFHAWIDGTSGSSQGGYLFVSDAAVNITIDAGNASTTRTDRIIARIKDNPYDSSGATTGTVEYLKGNTTTGAATTVPASSLLLWEVSVPAGASAGGGGINFNTNSTVKYVYTVPSGGILPIGSATDRNAITSPATGATIYRTDADWLERYDGTQWRVISLPKVSSSANLSTIPNPVAGQVAVDTSTQIMWTYTGSLWIAQHHPFSASVLTQETYSSTTYGDMATVGPTVTVNTGTSALVTVSGKLKCSVADGVIMGCAVSGASTIAASTNFCLQVVGTNEMGASYSYIQTGLTPGSNTFRAKYRISFSGVMTATDRVLTVVPLP